MKSLFEIHTQKKGKISDKWESYIHFYEEKFAQLRLKNVSLLEIGVQNGGSLESWAEYFPVSKSILGCDIDRKCGLLKFSDEKISVLVGDIKDAHTVEEIINRGAPFNIIIDDGSHSSQDIMAAISRLFKDVAPGGLYIIEDTHSLYDGVNTRFDNGALSFFKFLTDVVNAGYCDLNRHPYFEDNSDIQISDFLGWVEGIEFRDSLVYIKKSLQASKSRLGSRLTYGTEALVQNWNGRMKP